MIYIFHGDDLYRSRQALNQLLETRPDNEILRLDHKEFDYEKLNLFINSPSFFSDQKTLSLQNPFSLVKANLDKLIKLLQSDPQIDIILWQDRLLKATELKHFPSAKVQKFPISKTLFACLNSLKPGNHHSFAQLYLNTLNQEPFELLFFWFKNRLRQNLSNYSPFTPDKLKSTYLSLIDLEYSIKTGQIQQSKEDALLNLLLSLMS